MTTPPLGVKEIAKLTMQFDYFHTYIGELEQPIIKYIKYPQIPAELSESLVYHFIRDGIILEDLSGGLQYGGEADLTLEVGPSEMIRIEVKATSRKGFQRFGQPDLDSDYLVWLHFGSYFFDSDDNSVEVLVSKDISQYFNDPPVRLEIDDFKPKCNISKIIILSDWLSDHLGHDPTSDAWPDWMTDV